MYHAVRFGPFARQRGQNSTYQTRDLLQPFDFGLSESPSVLFWSLKPRFGWEGGGADCRRPRPCGSGLRSSGLLHGVDRRLIKRSKKNSSSTA